MNKTTGKERILTAVLWIWVCAGLAAYLYQFAGIAGSIFTKLGLA